MLAAASLVWEGGEGEEASEQLESELDSSSSLCSVGLSGWLEGELGVALFLLG